MNEVLDMLERLTDRAGMVLRGVAEMSELHGLVDEAKSVLRANAPAHRESYGASVCNQEVTS